MTDWITNRRPTEKDGDLDGDVRVRYSPGSDDSCYLHWSYVGEGAPWKHCDSWQPPAAAPAKPALALGQTWRRRDGKVVTIEKHDRTPDTKYHFQAGDRWYRPDGTNVNGHADIELIELISEAEPAPPSTTPRKFKETPRRTILGNGDHIIDVIDEDGTAWWMRIDVSPHHLAFPPPEPAWKAAYPSPRPRGAGQWLNLPPLECSVASEAFSWVQWWLVAVGPPAAS